MSDSDSYSEDYSDDFDAKPAVKEEEKKEEEKEEEKALEEVKKEEDKKEEIEKKEVKADEESVSASESEDEKEVAPKEEEKKEAPKDDYSPSASESDYTDDGKESEGKKTPTISPVKASTPPATQPPRTAGSVSTVGDSPGAKSAPASVPPSPQAIPKKEEDDDLDQATEEELAQIKTLKGANEELRQHLLKLNNQLDDALNQRGEKIVQITRVRKEPDVDKLQKDIDKLRKRNSKLQERIMQSESVGQIHELQNIVNEKARQVDVLREENRSLENVARNQAKKLASVQYIEDRINQARDQHMEEMRHSKEKIQKLKSLKDEDDRTVKHQQQQLNLLQTKIKAAGQAGKAGPKSAADLEKKLLDRQEQVETLKTQVHALTKSNETEKKRLHQQMKGSSNELKTLQAEAERLRALVSQQDNEPFPILSSSPKRRSKALSQQDDSPR